MFTSVCLKLVELCVALPQLFLQLGTSLSLEAFRLTASLLPLLTAMLVHFSDTFLTLMIYIDLL